MSAKHVRYHHWELPEDRNRMVVIRGLLVTENCSDIEEELREKYKLTIQDVKQFRGPGNTMYPLFLVKINKSHFTEEIFKIDRLLYTRVKVEPYRQGRAQMMCYRCLAFNHSQRHCHNRERCLRCGGAHSHKTCPRPFDDPVCFRCGDKHAACFKGCSKWPANRGERRQQTLIQRQRPLEAQQNRRENTQPDNSDPTSDPRQRRNPPPTATTTDQQTTAPANPTLSWADIAANRRTSQPEPQDPAPSSQGRSSVSMPDFFTLFGIFQEYFPKFMSAVSVTAKISVVWEALNALTTKH